MEEHGEESRTRLRFCISLLTASVYGVVIQVKLNLTGVEPRLSIWRVVHKARAQNILFRQRCC